MGFVGEFIKVLSLPCEEHAPLISRALDDELTPGLRWGLMVHETYCAGCRGYHRQLETVRRAARRGMAPVAVGGAGIPEEVRERLVRRVVAHAGAARERG